MASAVGPAPRRVVPSRFVPRGQAWEVEVEDLLGPVMSLGPDGRPVRPRRAVLYVNADDYQEAAESAGKGQG